MINANKTSKFSIINEIVQLMLDGRPYRRTIKIFPRIKPPRNTKQYKKRYSVDFTGSSREQIERVLSGWLNKADYNAHVLIVTGNGFRERKI